jgi:hypothetical protein
MAVSDPINLNDPAITVDLERRLYDLKCRFINAYGIGVEMDLLATEVRATQIAVRLAETGEMGQTTAEGILEYLVPACEMQAEDFWESALGRVIAYQCGASGKVGDGVNRRMVLQVVAGISRQGSYKVQAGLRTDGSGNITAEALRDYLQKREASNA